MSWKRKAEMLFDVDPKLVKTLAREHRAGARDVVIKPVSIGVNAVTYVGAKSMRGLEFVKVLEQDLPKISLEWEDDDDDEDEEETGEEEEQEEDAEGEGLDLGDEDDEEDQD
jgi:hypothetical protein